MKISLPHTNSISFLSGGGEMGALMRAKDWSKTSIGNPEIWPQSLRTTLSIILNSKFPMFLWWGPELTCFYNDAYRPCLGQEGKHPSILGMKAEDAWTEIWDVIKPLIDQVLAGGEATWREDQLIPIYRNGKLEDVYWTFSYSPVSDESGKVAGVLVTCNETTEKITVLDRAEQNQKKLSIAIEAGKLGTWELDLITKTPKYSSRYLEIIGGYTEDIELTHAQILQHLHPDDLYIRENAFKEAYKTGYLHYQSRLIWNDKSIHWMEGRGKVFYDENKKPIKMLGTLRDITDEKNQEQLLLEREEKFRLLADSMPQHIWTSDPEGNLNYFNKSVFDYSGLTVEQITKDGWLQIVHPDDKEENIRLWIEAISTGKDFLFEHRFRRHDGAYRWQLSRAIPQKDSDGKIQMWVGTSTDIEDQKNFSKELEEQVHERTMQLEQKNIDLQKMNKELESFAYISSHDLQEPLRKIQTFSTQIVAKEIDKLSDEGKDNFQRMQNAAKRMQTLIEDLLLYSRTNTAERKYELIDLKPFVTEVIEELKEEIQNKQALVEINDMCSASIISFQFKQLLQNLISNALKFSAHNKQPHIQITGEIISGKKIDNNSLIKELNYCHIRISDNGIGFEQQYSERIFQVFQRLHGRAEYKGTGIGLSIVKKIVDNHNGIITAQGEPDKGAIFDIYFPIN